MHTHEQQPDAHIIARILSGHRDDFEVLVERYEPAVRSVAFATVSQAAWAEEVTQEAFVQAFVKLGTLREKARFGPWVCAIARNAGLMLRRRQAREAPLTQSAAEAAYQEGTSIEQRELHQMLRLKLEALPEDQREVLLLHYFAHKTTQEMADLLDISRDAVKKRLERARHALAKVVLEDLGEVVVAGEAPEQRRKRVMAAVLLMPAVPDSSTLAPTTPTPVSIGSWAMPLAASALVLIAFLALGAVYMLDTPPSAVAAASDTTPFPTIPAPAPPAPDVEAAAPSAPEATLLQDVPATSAQYPAENEEPPAIHGRVVDAVTKEPIPGAEVVAHPLDNQNAPPAKTMTDASGSFSFPGLPAGSYQVKRTNTPQGYRETPMRNEGLRVAFSPHTPGEELLLELAPEAPVRGVVLDLEGKPMAGAKVSSAGGHEVWQGGNEVTDAEGRFAIHGLNPTRDMWIAGTTEQLVSAHVQFDLGPEGKTDLVLQLAEGASISGIVVDDEGTPVAGATVSADQPMSRMGSGGGVSDANGQFMLERLPAGSYVIGAFEGTQRPWEQMKPIELQAGEKVEGLTLKYLSGSALTISGTVSDHAGQPLPGVKVSANSGRFRAKTDATGAFLLEGMPEGVHRMEAEAEGYIGGDLSGVPAGTEEVRFTLTQVQAQFLRGQVVDRDTGSPIPSFELAWSPVQQGREEEGPLFFTTRRIVEWTKFTDTLGRFEAPLRQNYRVEKMHLFVQAPGYSGTVMEVRLGQEAKVSLSPGPPLQGKVTDENGAPLAGATFYYYSIPAWGRERTLAESRADGSFTIPSFPENEQYLCAVVNGYAPATVLVPKGYDRAQPLLIALLGGGTIVVRGKVPEGAQAMVGVESSVRFRGYNAWQPLPPGGELRLENLPADTHEVRLSLSDRTDGYRSTDLFRTVELQDGQVETVEFTLPEGSASLTGAVDCGTLNVGGIFLELTYPSPPKTRTDTGSALYDGTYTIPNLPTGPATLKVTVGVQGGDRRELETAVHLEPGENVLDIAVAE